ncbi:hypothetical protein [Streptomyces albireticuli]|uniref:Uncharacterized protein n=1 Tax=Streptomyces albireticuli TaxID=1940 RepID=A0A2A2D8G0_9ACTN|nr:hypothetical protein [Streptomyces albireticuli]MCD9145492.1 hypothetical protein [Streptomyces albireticuli]MCD9164943.1 hypothetical protein [Streptomyces albireticuli]MCD9195466.1 hypothetical protein [Streptomyces albireticuli]PAU48748.1 hypothetical protein CK936_11945 [Streptomyces albireticuli]
MSIAALQRLTEPSPDAGQIGLGPYAAAVAAHCLYLAPSTGRGLTRWELWEPADGGVGEPAATAAVEGALFAAGPAAAERARKRARLLGPLVCENVTVRWGAPSEEQRRLLVWPHWALKCLYAPVGLMAGKFWRGEVADDRRGRPVPPPPLSFLSLRPAVRTRDPQLLTSHPEVGDIIAVAADDGRDVLAPVLDAGARVDESTWPRVRAWAAAQVKVKGDHCGRG